MAYRYTMKKEKPDQRTKQLHIYPTKKRKGLYVRIEAMSKKDIEKNWADLSQDSISHFWLLSLINRGV